ncbi:MAG: DUF58 domain-containing protein [Bacteroidales bacterium]|nr:DUF58 domain-containing protein [Bacteroidales bacterium]MBK7172999.1 DUF58 domain-containing protein [Bacteroidales bacterium]
METTEILKKVRKIEIKSRGLSQQIFSGHYHSAFKGRGMAFSEVREYQFGDEIRSIDWNVTARFNHPYVKVFEEERELTVMLLIDVSGSHEFGTRKQFKAETMTEIAAVIAFSAIQNNDKVGVIFFSDRIEKFIPPKKGTYHILRIIRELLYFKPESHKTDLSEAFRFLTNAIKKRCTAFIISDFMDSPFEKALRIASGKHDIVALRVYDHRETELPSVGIMEVYDKESGERMWVDTSEARVRRNYKEWWINHSRQVEGIMMRCGVDSAIINTEEDYVKPLLQLFSRRELRY